MISSSSLPLAFLMALTTVCLRTTKRPLWKFPKSARLNRKEVALTVATFTLISRWKLNPDLSVFESHEIADQVESMLEERFGIFDTDVHIEPAPIPEDEILDNVYKKIAHA